MKIAKRILHILFKAVEIFVAFILVIGGLGFGLLYLKPIEINEFLPTLETYILPKNSGLKLNAESMTLRAALENKGLFHIDIKNMTLNKEDNTPALELPDVEFSYSLKHILSLNYVPSDLTLKNAILYLIIGENGQVRLYGNGNEHKTEKKSAFKTGVELSADNNALLDNMIQQILSFRSLSMENTTVKVEDRQKGEEIALNELSLYMERQRGHNHAIQLSSVLQFKNQSTPIKMEAQLNKFSKKMSFDIEFDTLDLKNLSRDLPLLSGANLTVGGKANGLLDFGSRSQNMLSFFKEGAFQIKTVKEGTLNLPEPLTNLYHIESAAINGAIGADFGQIKIAKSIVQLKNGPSATIQVDVSGIGEFMTHNDLKAVKTTLKADLSTLPLAQVPDVWPVATGPDAHQWVKENLKKGTVEKAEFTLNFIGGDLTDLYGELPVSGAEIRYLDEMTPVQNFAGTVKLYPDRVLIAGNKGNIWNLKLTDATIDLTELTADIPQTKITLDIAGPVQEAMNLISEKPLEFTQMFGLNPKQTGGNATVHVDLAFPLTDDLDTDQVQVSVSSKINDGIFPIPLDNQNLKKGNFDLSVNNQRLFLTGTGEVMEIPLNIQWTESFVAKKPTDIQSDYKLSSRIESEKLIAVLPQLKGYINGTAEANASIQVNFSEAMNGNFDINFEKMFLNLAPLSTQKPADVPANAKITWLQNKNKNDLTYLFKGTSDGKGLNPIQITGKASIQDKNWQVNLSEIIAPKTNMNITFKSEEKNMNITVKGKSWNAEGIYNLPDNADKKSEPFAFPKDLEFNIDLNRLILAEDKSITTLMGSGVKKNNRWQSLTLNAMAGAPFNLSYLKKKDAIIANTPDLGAFLSHLGITDKMSKGAFTLEADQLPGGGFKGKITAKDVVLKDPGFLIQASTILGIVDGIRGKDLLFSEGLIPFELKPDPILHLELAESYLAGNSLGITFMGNIKGSDLSLTGSVIPAYMINSLPGKIPLIGALFRGSEAGGLIGARYDIKGKLSSPEVTFHPLDSMAPGILGKIFD